MICENGTVNAALNGPTPESITAKICSMVILSAASLVAGVLPVKLGAMFYQNATKNKIAVFEKVMSFFLHFGAGVLICTIFLHLMPEMREKMSEIIACSQLMPSNFELPYSDLIVCFGFFLIYSIEQITHSYLMVEHEDTSSSSSSASSSSSSAQPHLGPEENDFELRKSCTLPGAAAAINNRSDNVAENRCVNYKIVENAAGEVRISVGGGGGGMGCPEHKHIIKDGFCEHKNYHSCENQNCDRVVKHYSYPAMGRHQQPQPQLQHIHGAHDNSQLHAHHHIPDFSNSVGSGLLMVMALSLHEIFEGVAVGLQNDAAQVWYLLAAISCHKTVLAAFIGLQLLATETQLFVSYAYIVIYSVTSSLGIFVGLLISVYSQLNDYLKLTSITLQGIASGTLIYVVFFEIYFKNESRYQLSGSLKSLSSVLGFLFMALLQVHLSEDKK